MLLNNFDNLTTSWSRKRLRDRIVKLFSEPNARPPSYSFKHLYEVVRPPNATQLATTLSELVTKGVLQQFVVVESPETKTTIQRFASMEDVPREIHDDNTDTYFEVRPENMKVMYTRHA